jgi:hypothetical protein
MGVLCNCCGGVVNPPLLLITVGYLVSIKKKKGEKTIHREFT